MPTETSIGLSQKTRDELDDYRSPGHASMEETVEGMMKMLPSAEEILEDGCRYSECERNHWSPAKPEDKGGVIQWFHTEVPPDDKPIWSAGYFCSTECAAAAQDEIDRMVPRNPDEVVVGGYNELRTAVEGARFFLDYETREVSIDVPGAFSGLDDLGNEYAYEGEPVYIIEDGRVRQTGIIENIIHEETHTALILAPGYTDHVAVMANHPDHDRREEFLDGYCHRWDATCPECEETIWFGEDMDQKVECGECGETISRPSVPVEDLPDPVREHRAQG